MSKFRIQTAKATRQHSNRGPMPTPASSWTAQTKRDNAIENVRGARGLLQAPRGRSTEPEDIQVGGDLSDAAHAEAPSSTRTQHT